MMKKLKLFFACLLMAVLSIGQVWADKSTLTFTDEYKDSGATADDDVSWTVTSDGTESTYDATKGIHYGTSSAQVQYIRLSTSGITGTITQVKVNASTASGVSATVGVTVGGAAFGGNPKSLTTSAAEYTFTDEATGAIVVEITKPSKAAKAIYCKSVEVTYSTGGGTVAVSSVTLDENAITLDEEATQTLTATVLPTNATNKNVTWESDDEEVATVVNGVVTAVGAGDATITCKSVADNTKSATCSVHVNASPYTKSKLIFTSACGGSGTADDDAEWTVESDGTESVYDATCGIHYGTGSANVTYLQLATSDIEGSVARVVVNARDAQATATISVTVGGTAFTCESATATNTSADYSFTGTGSGEIVVRVDRGSSMSKAIYVKSVVVYYIPAPQKQNTGLAYAVENYLVKVGASLAPELTNPNSLTGITYASSDADVVAVNETTGALTIKAAGKAVITASREADDTYKAGSASYTVYVATEAGTAADPLTEASAKALIDLGCTMDAHVHGVVTGSQAANFTVTLANGFQFYKLKDLNNVAFESAYLKNGDEVTAVGTLTKYGNSTYELAEGCYLTAYTEYTEPLVDISNTKATAYTVAEALVLAVNPTSDLTKAVYIKGVVYDVKNFNSTNGTLDIYIKDEGVDNKFEFYKCAGIYDESLTAFTAADDVQVGDEVIGYGVMKYFSGGSIWEFDNTATGDYLVDLVRPEVAVSSVELDQNAASIEVNETVTLHATVNPENASNKAITWSVQSGNTYASVADGVVTGLVAGEAVIRAASTADPTKYAECTVTVTAADPSKHVVTFDATTDTGDSPLSKSNITFTCSSGALNNGSEYRLYKNSATTFECSVGNITKIEFTGVSGNPVSGFGDPEEGTLVTDGNNGVWTGNTASVSFVASGAQVRATEITVTYKEDNRAAAGLSWSTDAVVLTVGETFTAPTLNNPNSIASSEITIASDNEDLAIVTAGVVSLKADATGEATITATFDGNEDYKPATVSYTITVNEAGLDNVTFDATLDVAETGELSISKSGFTLEFTGGAMDNSENYRLYKSQTMTLSSTAYFIKKIEFTCTSGNPISGFADAEGLDKANNQWTGQANSVELTASNAQVRIEKLKVYYIEDTRAVSGLAWSTDEIEITLGDAFTPATLNNPNSIDASAITIESDNTDLAIVTAGVVSLEPDKIGTAHITATFAGNETYKPATVSYTIIVNDPNPEIITNPTTNLNFGSVEEGATITAKTLQVTLQNVAAATVAITGDGKAAFSVDETALTGNITLNVSASSANQGTFNATLTISDNASLATAKEISLSLTVTEPVVEDDVTGTWTLVTSATTLEAGKKVIIAQYVDADGAINTMAGQASNNRSVIASTVAGTTLTPAVGTKVMTLANAGEGKFYLMTSDDEYLYNASTSSKSYLRTKEEADDASWTIAVDAEGVATITSVENTNRINMRYNENGSNPALFNCYATGQNDIALYMHEDATPEPDYTEVRSGLEPDRYYTVCLPRKVVAVKGATFWTLKQKNMEGSLAYLEEETNNLPFEAGKPFIIQATANKLEVIYNGDATETPGVNGAIHGTLVYMDADALAAAGSDVYMLYQNELRPVGVNNHLDANRAYVKINELDAVPEAPQNAPGRRVVAMPMEKDVTTDINALNAAEAPVKMIIDGNLFILRGEKLYDATGRLVK